MLKPTLSLTEEPEPRSVEPVGIAVGGLGYRGPNLLRVLAGPVVVWGGSPIQQRLTWER